MLELSNSSHLLEQKSYKYQLQDVAEPILYRDVLKRFRYGSTANAR